MRKTFQIDGYAVNKRGNTVGIHYTLTGASPDNRVKFSRDGYEFPCVFPLERFVKEFSFVSWGMSDAK